VRGAQYLRFKTNLLGAAPPEASALLATLAGAMGFQGDKAGGAASAAGAGAALAAAAAAGRKADGAASSSSGSSAAAPTQSKAGTFSLLRLFLVACAAPAPAAKPHNLARNAQQPFCGSWRRRTCGCGPP